MCVCVCVCMCTFLTGQCMYNTLPCIILVVWSKELLDIFFIEQFVHNSYVHMM